VRETFRRRRSRPSNGDRAPPSEGEWHGPAAHFVQRRPCSGPARRQQLLRSRAASEKSPDWYWTAFVRPVAFLQAASDHLHAIAARATAAGNLFASEPGPARTDHRPARSDRFGVIGLAPPLAVPEITEALVGAFEEVRAIRAHALAPAQRTASRTIPKPAEHALACARAAGLLGRAVGEATDRRAGSARRYTDAAARIAAPFSRSAADAPAALAESALGTATVGRKPVGTATVGRKPAVGRRSAVHTPVAGLEAPLQDPREQEDRKGVRRRTFSSHDPKVARAR
jgi:hypothetical protein